VTAYVPLTKSDKALATLRKGINTNVTELHEKVESLISTVAYQFWTRLSHP